MRACDGVAHQPRLVREQRESERQVRSADDEIPADRAHVTALGDAEAARHQAGQERKERGNTDGCEDEARPCERGSRDRPPDHQREKGRRSGQRPAQVVEHLPTTDEGNRGATLQDPRQQLPVTARPAVLAGGGDLVVRGELLEELDVGHQPGARERALEQIVAQQRVLGDPPGERGLERIDVVDAFSGVRAFTEEILVHVRHGSRVRVDPGRP